MHGNIGRKDDTGNSPVSKTFRIISFPPESKKTEKSTLNKACLLLFMTVLLSSSCASSRYATYPGMDYAVASWYGTEFHGRPTSSGEIYNMYAFTCAHKEYPFGTRLKITSVSSRKSVDCMVNDRGPFVEGRDIDLSYAAAKEIDLVREGVGKVRIQPLGRDSSYVRQVRYASSEGPFTIQVGSFSESSNAYRLRKALELKYRNVYTTEAEMKGNVYYRVRVGKFASKDAVRKTARDLADEGYEVLITGYDERI